MAARSLLQLPPPSRPAASNLSAVVPVAAACAHICASLYPLATRAAGAGSGGPAGARTPPRGTLATAPRPGARTPPRGSRALAVSIFGSAAAGAAPGASLGAASGGGGGAAGDAAALHERIIQACLMPAARLAGAAAAAALAAAAAADCTGGGEEAAVGVVQEALTAVAALACAVTHPDVLRAVLDAWAPLLLSCVREAAAASSAAAAAHAADAPAEAACQLSAAAAGAWSGTMAHWAALPVTEASAPHLQG